MNVSEFQAALQQEKTPVVVEFWARWCGPCKLMAPTLERLGKAYTGRVTLVKVDADEHTELLRELKVMAVPTLMVFQNGALVHRHTGSLPEKELSVLFERLAQVETQQQPIMTAGMDATTRFLRLFSGLALVLLGIWQTAWPLLMLGGLIAFWGWYDRCPVWQAVGPRLEKLLK